MSLRRLQAAPNAARFADPLGETARLDLLDRAADGGERLAEQRAPGRRGRLRRRGQRLQHLLLGLRAEARQVAQLLLLRGGPETVEVLDAELRPELPRRLRAEPGDVHHLDQPGRQLRPQLGERCHVAGLDDLDDLALDRPSDPGEPRRLPVDCELGHRDGRLADARGCAPVGGEPEGIGAVELQHVGEELEALGQL